MIVTLSETPKRRWPKDISLDVPPRMTVGELLRQLEVPCASVIIEVEYQLVDEDFVLEHDVHVRLISAVSGG